jgi:hypothetical protein
VASKVDTLHDHLQANACSLLCHSSSIGVVVIKEAPPRERKCLRLAHCIPNSGVAVTIFSEWGIQCMQRTCRASLVNRAPFTRPFLQKRRYTRSPQVKSISMNESPPQPKTSMEGKEALLGVQAVKVGEVSAEDNDMRNAKDGLLQVICRQEAGWLWEYEDNSPPLPPSEPLWDSKSENQR